MEQKSREAVAIKDFIASHVSKTKFLETDQQPALILIEIIRQVNEQSISRTEKNDLTLLTVQQQVDPVQKLYQKFLSVLEFAPFQKAFFLLKANGLSQSILDIAKEIKDLPSLKPRKKGQGKGKEKGKERPKGKKHKPKSSDNGKRVKPEPMEH